MTATAIKRLVRQLHDPKASAQARESAQEQLRGMGVRYGATEKRIGESR